MSQESVLNEFELSQVIEEAKNPIYRQQNLYIPGRKKTDVLRVSPNKMLILIKGNSKTGFEHINQRHSNVYRKPYWNRMKQDGTDKYILDNPSRFSISTIPFFDYIRISEALYTKENLNAKNNTSPEYCDVYEGQVELNHIEKSHYRLILYKETRVIHNLYPIGGAFTPKKIINYHKGSASMKRYLSSCVSIISIPYFDYKETVIYRVIFRLDEFEKSDKLYIEICSKNGDPLICRYIGFRPLKFDLDSPLLMMAFEFSDMSYVENVLAQIDSKRNWA